MRIRCKWNEVREGGYKGGREGIRAGEREGVRAGKIR